MTRSYDLQARADRRAAALERRAELAATGTNELTERRSLYSAADRPMTAREKAHAEAEQRRYVLYTREERQLIATLYNNGGTRETIVSAFRQVFGNRHSSASIGQKVEMCRVADRRQPEHTAFVFRDEQLLDILTDLDAERYVVG
jgi:hypothetical protein